MSSYKTQHPYDTFKKFSENWEKQINDMIHLWTNNSEFVGFAKMNANTHAKYTELFKKNQELLATQLNIPTKSDLANVSKLTIQAEEKLDLLEEQIWSLADSFKDINKEVESVVDVSREIIKATKQLKTELAKTKKQLSESTALKQELQEVKEELAMLSDIKEELAELKGLIRASTTVNKEAKELVLVGE